VNDSLEWAACKASPLWMANGGHPRVSVGTLVRRVSPSDELHDDKKLLSVIFLKIDDRATFGWFKEAAAFASCNESSLFRSFAVKWWREKLEGDKPVEPGVVAL